MSGGRWRKISYGTLSKTSYISDTLRRSTSKILFIAQDNLCKWTFERNKVVISLLLQSYLHNFFLLLLLCLFTWAFIAFSSFGGHFDQKSGLKMFFTWQIRQQLSTRWHFYRSRKESKTRCSFRIKLQMTATGNLFFFCGSMVSRGGGGGAGRVNLIAGQ